VGLALERAFGHGTFLGYLPNLRFPLKRTSLGFLGFLTPLGRKNQLIF